MDTQVVEMLGRNWLTAELLAAGLEVARPEPDRGIDVVAFSTDDSRFVARPIQMKASAQASFGLDAKYEKFSDLILAYVWYVGDPRKTLSYAMTYGEALSIAEQLGWTQTESWLTGASSGQRRYVTTRPGKRVVEVLEPYLMTPDKWRNSVLS